MLREREHSCCKFPEKSSSTPHLSLSCRETTAQSQGTLITFCKELHLGLIYGVVCSHVLWKNCQEAWFLQLSGLSHEK